MKKYKIKPLNGYYHYKVKKIWLKRLLFLIIGFSVICFGIIGNRQDFGEDLKELNLERVENKNVESIYIDGNKVEYGLYKQKQEVRGIYIPASKVEDYEEYIAMAKRTNVNSFVIDVKNDQGYLTFASSNNVATEHFPGLAMKDLEGEVFETKTGDKWLNPYNKENWEYILEVCKEAIKVGFKEIQFDYIRFHESMTEERVQLGTDKSKSEVITEFVTYMCESLKEYGVSVSADVFGAVVMSKVDGENVGQDFNELCKHLDYICPMVYPSHYAAGTFGIEYPHIQCYDIILRSMELAQDRLMENPRDERKAQIRPWLQDFTLAGMEPYQFYGEEQIRSQIQGTYDAGIDEWLFWNASGKYTEAGLDDE